MHQRPPNDYPLPPDPTGAGGRAAFEELVRAQTPRLFRIAFRVTGDAALSEDVVQETFLRLLENRHSIRRRGAGDAWLARVAVHTAIDLFRRRSARTRREEAHAMSDRKRVEDPVEAVLKAEEAGLLAEAFASLPFETRAAIWLNVVERDPVREIAEAFGTSAPRMYKQIRKGLFDLRTFLERRRAVALLAVPLPDLLTRLPAPSTPEGLITRIAKLAGDGGTGPVDPRVLDFLGKGGIAMATVSGKKIGTGIAIALLLLLGTSVIVDPFRWWRGEPRGARSPIPLASPTAAAASAGRRPAAGRGSEAVVEEKTAVLYGSLVVHVMWGDDQTAAAGVRVFLDSWTPSPSMNDHRAVTGEDGAARFARVRPGRMEVYLYRGGKGVTDVKAGAESEITIEIPPGTDVEGIVVDGDGKPVPGASIWLSGHQNTMEGAVIGAAGPDGTFRIRSVRSGHYVGARAPGFAPSLLHEIEGRPGGVESFRLSLDTPGVIVAGTVLDPAERPVTAWLQIEYAERFGGSPRPVPLIVRSDERGRFAFENVPVGDVAIAVLPEALAPFEDSLAVPEEGIPDLRIVLEAGVTITGSIRTAAGEPAQGASVEVGFYGRGHGGIPDDEFLGRGTSAGPDGSFRLVGVRPGEFEVRADGDKRGKASERFTAEAGAEVRWEATLSTGLEILGRVVDENGKPLGGVLVGAEGEKCGHGFIRTGRDGRFRFLNCKPVPHRLTAGTSEEIGFPSLSKSDVLPGKEEVTLVLSSGARPSAFLVGSVRDPEGKPGEKAQIDVMIPSIGTGQRKLPQPDGSFRIGPLPPTAYFILVSLGDLPPVALRRVLTAGETTDLGMIQFHRGGRLEARLRMANGSPVPGMPIRVSSTSGDQELSMKLSPDGPASSDPSPPGEYAVLIWGQGVASAWIPVRIEDRETTSIDVAIREGARRVFRISASAGAPDEPVRVLVRAGDGKTVFDWQVQPDSGWKAAAGDSSRTLDLGAGFAPGTYAAEASGAGLRAQVSFTVESLDEAAPPILLDLR
jgi:RNA polymerase sigma factor (sigma-70 family)